MNFPRGNVLLKPISLELEDLKVKLSNLQHHGFNGYVKAEAGDYAYYIFLKEGLIKGIVQSAAQEATLISELLLYHRLRKLPVTIASYVLSPELVDVLSFWYTFSEKYVNYQVRKQEFLKVLKSLDGERMTGAIEIRGVAGRDSSYFLLAGGHIVTDTLLDRYGQIVTGPAHVSEIIDKLGAEGGVIAGFGEKSELIDRKAKEMGERLSQYKELFVSIESSLLPFGNQNTVRIDENIFRDWTKYGTIQKVDLIVGQEQPVNCRVTGKRGLGSKIVMGPALAKKLGLLADEPLLVKPG